MVCNHAPDRGDPLRVADTQLVKLQVGAHVDVSRHESLTVERLMDMWVGLWSSGRRQVRSQHVVTTPATECDSIILEGATDAARHLADEAVRVTQLVLDSISVRSVLSLNTKSPLDGFTMTQPGTTNHDLVVKVAEHLAPTGYRGVPGLLAHSVSGLAQRKCRGGR